MTQYRLRLLIHGHEFMSQEVPAVSSEQALDLLGFNTISDIERWAVALEALKGNQWIIS